jgi:hypothetical protein
MADVSSIPFINYAQNTADANLTQAQVPVQQAQAQLFGQQTQAAATANQVAQLKLKLFQGAMAHLNDFSGQKPTSADMSAVAGQQGPQQDADSSGTAESPYDIGLSPADPGAVAKALKSKYFVNPVGTPQEQANIIAGYYSGDDGLAKGMVAQRDMGVAQRTYQNNIDSSALYDTMDAVHTAPPGAAVAQLRAVAPNTAAQIEKAARNPDGTENVDQADQMARDYAAHIGVEAHQYTGRPTTTRADGVPVDEKTLKPIAGASPSGISADQYAKLITQGNTLVDVFRNGKETKVKQYEADDYPDVDTWARASYNQWQAQHGPVQQSVHPAVIQAAQQKAAQTAQKVIQAHQQQQQQGGGSASPGQQQPAQAPGNAAPTPQQSGVAPTPGAPGTPTGGLQTGATPTAATGAGLTPEQQNFVRSAPPAGTPASTGNSKPSDADMDLQKKTQNAKIELYQESQTDTAQARNSLTNVARAQALLDKNPTLGPAGGFVSTVQTLLQNMTAGHAADFIESNNTIHDLLLKTLTADQLNSMLSKLHSEGAKVALGAGESKLIIGSMTANTQISKGAIQQMLNWEKSDALYTLGKANTTRAYLAAGKDPLSYDYEGTFARPTANLSNANTKAMPAGDRLNAYAAKHFGGDTAKAAAYLSSQGYK